MTLKAIVRAAAVSCAALVIAASASLAAQTTAQPPQAPQTMTHPMTPQPAMAAKCQAMMAEHDKMMAGMKTADQRLDGLVAKMNAASGAEKTTATAVVVTEMVAQRATMRDGMMKMQEGMMTHMMEHMQEGKDSLAMCPMMKHKGDAR